MDLTRALLRIGAVRPHVLVVEVPGGTAARLAVERELRRRGWPSAASQADADLVVVTGPVNEVFTGYVERLWREVPRPLVRIEAPDGGGVGPALDDAARSLATGGDPDDHDGIESDLPGTCPWPTAVRIGTASFWTSSTCRWDLCCRTGLRG